jgi:hypothetical protein
MIGVQRLEKMLRTIQCSIAIEGARPLNSIIIGPSGSGKSMLLATAAAANSAVLMDFTAESLLQYLDKNKPKYIICPDLNLVVSHRPTVAGLTVACLLAITGEGVSKVPGIDGRVKFSMPDGYVCGLMTAVTYGMYISKRGKWREIGLLRRLLPLYFSYLPDTAASINQEISKGMVPHYAPKTSWTIPDGKVKVNINEDISHEINSLASETVKQLTWNYTSRSGERRTATAVDYSFDLHLMFRTYAKCAAFLRGSDRVDEKDYEEVRELSRFVRLDAPCQI